MRFRSYWYIYVLVLLLTVSCASSKKTVETNTESQTASIYNPSKLALHPDYSIFHEGDNFSTLYVRAYPSELKFSQANSSAEYRALLSVKYELMELDHPDQDLFLVDSSSIQYKIGKSHEDKPAFFAALKLPVKQGKRYMLKVESKDPVRGSMGMKYLYVDKTNKYTSQNFKVVSARTGYPKFLSFFLSTESFMVQYRDKQKDSVSVQFFTRHNELPRPPITASGDYTMSYEPDTIYRFPLTDSSIYNLRSEGRYLIQVDAEVENGLALYNFGGSFPDVESPDELMEPLFYLTTLAEYHELSKSSNRKMAVDNFWLKTEDNMERSRELIRVYYNRVIYSNYYFSTNKEGWKTDPGMIFILFGPPNRIKMDGKGESWLYYYRKGGRMVEFRFNRQHDIFSDSNLVWTKTTDSQMFWNEAVRSWRKGKVYSMSN